MIIKKPAEEVKACDICERESGWLDTCIVCGKEYCLSCDSTITGCIHTVGACKKCGQLDAVRLITDKYAPKIRKVLDSRDTELAKILLKGGSLASLDASGKL